MTFSGTTFTLTILHSRLLYNRETVYESARQNPKISSYFVLWGP